MMCRRSRRCAWLLAGLSMGCGAKSHQISLGGESEDELARRSNATLSVGRSCVIEKEKLPDTLECTGLYSNIKSKTVAKGVVEFAPATPLWSDAAHKRRWIYVPPGQKIDNSAPNDWVFPVGTRAWKEFQVGGKRIETRLFQKMRADLWRRGTYVWNEDESQAEFSFGGDIPIEGGEYHVPEHDECDDCHEGATDRLLGFDAVSLGLPGATGLTLALLAKHGWLSEQPERVELAIGDDGTGLAAEVLPMLHVNCGTSCHNGSVSATANLTSQLLRLDSTQLDGSAPDASWDIIRTMIGKEAEGTQWGGGTRIVPGDPDESLAYQLMSVRTGGNGQMPPIATRVVDHDAVKLLRDWILQLDPEAFE
jgi:hypothetical protein